MIWEENEELIASQRRWRKGEGEGKGKLVTRKLYDARSGMGRRVGDDAKQMANSCNAPSYKAELKEAERFDSLLQRPTPLLSKHECRGAFPST